MNTVASASPNPYAPPKPRVRLSAAPLEPLPIADFELAQPGARLLARVVDNLVFYGPWFLMFLVGSEWVVAAGLLVFQAVVVVQAVLVTKTGATIGKRLCGIKMIRHDGGEVGFVRGWLVRTFIYGILELVGSFMLAFIPGLVDSLMIFTRHGQTLHDRIAGTYVVKAR